MGQFRFMGPRSGQHWFRVGTLDVTTTVFVTALCVLSFVVWAVSPSLLAPLVLLPYEVTHGKVWELVTWPFANAPSLQAAVAIAIFWWLGSQLEAALGRIRFLWFLGVVTVLSAAILTAICALTNNYAFGAGGITPLEFGVVAGFAAAYPGARFFFGIPFWILAAAVLAIEALSYIGSRLWTDFLFLVIIVAISLLLSRAFGAARQAWIPQIPLPSLVSGDRSRRDAKRRRKAAHLRVVRDDDVNALLDKIAAHGIDSLSRDERRRLDEHSRSPRK